MIEKEEEEIIRYFLKFMCGKKNIVELLQEKNAPSVRRSGNIQSLIDYAANEESLVLTKKDITTYARKKYLPHLYDINQQKELIQSGDLKGHSWHQAAPSRLHLTLQRWVRSYLSDELSLENYMKRVTDVAKQEIYMLVGANITEYLIAKAEDNIIPNLRQMGISDVIINHLAYDVKNTHNPNTCPHDLRNEPIECQEWLFDSGDLQRDLKTAAKAPPHLGYNRIYVIIDPVDKWETDLDNICDFIQNTIKKIATGNQKPHLFERQKGSRTIKVHTHLIVP